MSYRPAAVVSFVLAAFVASAGVACNDAGGGDTTTGTRVGFAVEVAPVARTFTTKIGWEVTLTKALVATGALYFFDGETLFARHAPRARPLDLFLGIRAAHAHPGHYVPGNAMGEMLTPSSVDLLAASATTIGNGQGVSGAFRSGTFTFGAPPAGPLAADMGGKVIVLEGTAKKGPESRTFRAEVAAEELLDQKGKPDVEGCPFSAGDVAGDGTVTVTVDADAWLDQVEFELLPKDAAPAKLVDVTQSELTRSVRGGDRYRFSFRAK